MPRPSRAASLALMDMLFKKLCQAAALLIILVAIFLVVILIEQSMLGFRTVGFRFLTEKDWNPQQDHKVFGAQSFIYGTLATSAVAMILAVPLGIGTAAYLSEIASPRVRGVASFFVEMLAAIPSVVYGFWGVFVLAPLVGDVATRLGAENTSGRGILSAGLVLSIMIVPYIAAIGFDVCQAVPRAQREGALALGSTRWQTIWKVVLPYARPGLIAGIFLALGRALGETMAVTMLIGNVWQINYSPFAAGDSIASVLANQYLEADNELLRSVLVELALVLLGVTVVLNAMGRVFLYRLGQRKSLLPFALFGRRRNAETEALSGSPTLDQRSDESTPTVPLPHPLRASSAGASRVNVLMTGVLGACVVFTMGMLVVIVTYLAIKGLGAFSVALFTELPPVGLSNAIVGSLQVVGWATVFAVPVGLLAAIYLAEYRAGPLANSTRFIAELLGGVPSIVIGLFAAGLFTIIQKFLAERFHYAITFYGWSGVFALTVMMVPIVMRAAEEALKLVPRALRNASYALGSSHAQTVLRVTVPAALPAIITAIFLSIARIAGETAPLLITAGFNSFWPGSLNNYTPTLPPYIWQYATNPSDVLNQQAWAGAFLLMVIVLLLNFGIRFVTGKRQVAAARAD